MQRLFFCDLCKNYTWVIGDQHLAIQFKRDSQLAISNEINRDINEEYTPTVTKEFLKKLKHEGINVLIFFLKAEPSVLLRRALDRFLAVGHVVRNHNEYEVRREIEAEISFFQDLIVESEVDYCVIDTTDRTDLEVYAYALRKTQEFARAGIVSHYK